MSTKQRVLVVDDNEITLRLTTHIFDRAGYEVYSAMNGHDGLVKATNLKPDLIILDVMMPDLSGLEVARRLREDETTAEIPIIILSARGEVDDKVGGFQAGADDYVQKPVAPKELLARATGLLQRLGRSQASEQAAPQQQGQKKIVAVMGAKGGVGVTTLAVNLAVGLASQNKSTILAELRAYPGTAAAQLRVYPESGLESLLAMKPAAIDTAHVAKELAAHASGLQVLSAPQRLSEHGLTPRHVDTLIKKLTTEMEYVVLDLPPLDGPATKQALERASTIFVLTERERLSLDSVRTLIQTLQSWGLADRLRLVIVSRVPSTLSVTPADIEKTLGVRLAGVIPPATEVVQGAIDEGKPFVLSRPETVVANTVMRMVGDLTGQVPPSANPTAPSLSSPGSQRQATSSFRRLKPRQQ